MVVEKRDSHKFADNNAFPRNYASKKLKDNCEASHNEDSHNGYLYLT